MDDFIEWAENNLISVKRLKYRYTFGPTWKVKIVFPCDGEISTKTFVEHTLRECLIKARNYKGESDE